jgi:Nidogen-like
MACTQPGDDPVLSPPVSDGSYTILDSEEPEVDYNWIDITAETEVTLGDEEFSAQVPVGFAFTLFDTNSNWAYLHSNGFITLQTSVSGSSYSPRQVPDSREVNLIIAGLWADLDPSAGGNIYYTTTGITPDQIFIVSYENVPYKDSSATVTFQILLYETTNNIEIQFQNFESDGQNHTVGIEDAAGTRGSFPAGLNLTDFTVADEYTIRFSP